MKEINQITAADLRAMEQLDQNCLDLHLFPPPKTFIQMEVEGPDGKKVESRKIRSQSWHRNAYNLIMAAITGLPASAISTTYGPGSIAIKTTSAATIDTSSAPTITSNGPVGAVGANDYGIIAGYDNAAENFNDMSLTLPAVQGTAMKVTKGGYPDSVHNRVFDVRFGRSGDIISATFDYSPFLVLYEFNQATKKISRINCTGGPTSTVYSAEVSPCGQYVAAQVGSYAKIYKYDNAAKTLSEVFSASCTSGGGYETVGWSPNGDYAFFCSGSGAASVHAKNNRNDTFTLYSISAIQSTTRCAWSEDSNYLAVGFTAGPFLKIFKNNNDGTLTEISATLGLAAQLNKISWSPDGKYLMGSSDAAWAYIFVKKTGIDTFEKISPTISGISNAIAHCEFSTDGKYILFRPSDSSYAKLAAIKNNNDDTFTLVDAGTSMYNSSSHNTFRTHRHPTMPFFLQSFNQYAPYFGIAAIMPGLSYSAQEATMGIYNAETKKMSVSLRRIINNNTTEAAAINELGLVARLNSAPVMLSRDVLAEPLEVPPAYKLTVTYTMEMTFPA